MHDASYWIETPRPGAPSRRRPLQGDLPVRRLTVPGEALPGYNGPRSLGTSIYFLLRDEEFSALHRIKQDELWHFYAGSALTVHLIDGAGRYTPIRMGPDPEGGPVPAGTGARRLPVRRLRGRLSGLRPRRLHLRPGLRLRRFRAADEGRAARALPTTQSAHRAADARIGGRSVRRRVLRGMWMQFVISRQGVKLGQRESGRPRERRP